MLTNDDCIWDYVFTGEVDEYGNDLGDYAPAGSYPPDAWEAQVLAWAVA